GPAHDRNLDAPSIEQPALDLIRTAPRDVPGRAIREDDARERADHVVRTRRSRADRRTQEAPRLERQSVILRHQRGPSAGRERAEIVDRSRHREPGGRIGGAGPVELEPESGARGARDARAVADRERPDLLLTVAPHPEKRGPLRRTEPLVAVAAVVRGTERGEVERDHPRRMGAVDEDLDAAAGQLMP